MKFFIAIILGLTCMSCVSATGGTTVGATTPPPRMMTNLNDGWMYLEDNTDDLSKAQAANDWMKIDLPHTWNPRTRKSTSWPTGWASSCGTNCPGAVEA